MQSVPQGSSCDLDIIVKDENGDFVDPTSLTLTVRNGAGVPVLENAEPTRKRQGFYRYRFSVNPLSATGFWSAAWSAVLPGGIEIEKDELIEVAPAGSPYRSESTNIETVNRGTRKSLDVIFRSGNVRANATDVGLALTDPFGQDVLISSDITNPAAGLFRGWWDVPSNATPGVWVLTATGRLDGVVRAVEYPMEVLASPIDSPAFSSGTERVAIGSYQSFDCVFRSSDGTLWDPEITNVVVYDPSMSEILNEEPTRIQVGVYRITLPLGVPGFWIMEWSGDDDGLSLEYASIVEVIASGPGMPTISRQHSFGADIQGVRALAAQYQIDINTLPTINYVDVYLDNIAAEVSLRIGAYGAEITDESLVGRVTAMAKYVVELGAAATAIDAGHPANVGPNQTSYGELLWERYRLALADLVGVVNNATAGLDPGAGIVNGIQVSAPPKFFTSFMEA